MRDLKTKKYVFSTAAVFSVVILFDFIVHQILLSNMYARTADVWRAPENMQMLPMFVSQLLFSLAFVFIFTRNYEKKGTREGLRYGLYIGLLIAALNLSTYSYLPIPFILTLCWMLAALTKCLLSGVVLARVYKAT